MCIGSVKLYEHVLTVGKQEHLSIQSCLNETRILEAAPSGGIRFEPVRNFIRCSAGTSVESRNK